MCSYAIDGVLNGDIRFQGLTKPVVRVELAIIKVETNGELKFDVLQLTVAVVDDDVVWMDGAENGVTESVPFHEILMDSRNAGDENLPFVGMCDIQSCITVAPPRSGLSGCLVVPLQTRAR